MGAPTPARPSLAEPADVRTGDVITTLDGKDMPAFAAATRSLSGAVDFTMEWDREDQTIAVQYSVLSAVPSAYKPLTNGAPRTPHRRRPRHVSRGTAERARSRREVCTPRAVAPTEMTSG
ncbi:hypothetical protein [Rhodococcus pseudokoreensis]|uniref:hypothetical protein n=1 Tax=Rhodococcus pseudokoreensis TaxID=2811421 RepID=UPI001F128A8E|nr:hypothetical protein [Rhodococcus pseudokoreensis]